MLSWFSEGLSYQQVEGQAGCCCNLHQASMQKTTPPAFCQSPENVLISITRKSDAGHG